MMYCCLTADACNCWRKNRASCWTITNFQKCCTYGCFYPFQRPARCLPPLLKSCRQKCQLLNTCFPKALSELSHRHGFRQEAIHASFGPLNMKLLQYMRGQTDDGFVG